MERTETPSRVMPTIILVLGALLLLAGTLAGTSRIDVVGQDCGSVFSPRTYGASSVTAAYVDVVCDNDRSARRTQVIVLLVTGAGAALAGAGRLAGRRRSAAVPTRAELTEELVRLHDLRQAGALSDEEYAAAKARLLRSS